MTCPAPPPTSPWLRRNLDAHLARWRIALPAASGARVQATVAPAHALPGDWPTDGMLAVRLADAAGTWLKLHSDRAPMREAADGLASLTATQAASPVLVIVGAGLGYLVDAALAAPARRVLVLEPEPDLIPWMLARRDWTADITAGRLAIVPGPAYEAAAQVWPLLTGVGAASPPVLVHPVVARTRTAAASAAGAAVGRALHAARANQRARRRFQAPYLLNTLAHTRQLATAPRLDALTGVAAGRPVVVVGAGPSLDDLLPALGAARAQLVIVATDTALPPLLTAGIAPDMVVAVDPGPQTARHMRRVPVPPATWLVAEASVDPACLEPFGERVVLFRIDDHAPWPWLAAVGLDPGTLRAWGSVVTSAFDLALRLGGESVIFAGVDLAYTRGRPYCRGTAYDDTDRLDTGDDDGLAPTPAAGLLAPDLHGHAVPTASHLVAFRDWLVQASLEAAARPHGTPRRFVNVTGAGILHGGVIVSATLDEALRSPSATRTPFALTAHSMPRATPQPRDVFDAHLLESLMTTPAPPPPPPADASPTPYMTLPRRDRVKATRRLRAAGATDVARWARPENFPSAWDQRAAVAARGIPPATRVLDLGAGREALARHLPADTTYTPADVVARSSRTVVVDLNAGDFPAGDYDVVTTLGVLEYIHDVRALLTTIATRTTMLVTSYCVVERGGFEQRLARGWVNDYELGDMLDLLHATGWHVATSTRLESQADFDQWVFTCRRQQV